MTPMLALDMVIWGAAAALAVAWWLERKGRKETERALGRPRAAVRVIPGCRCNGGSAPCPLPPKEGAYR